MLELVLKRFEKPDVVKRFEKGKFEMVSLAGMSIGRATYKPGWRWSEHVGKAMGLTACQVEHVGMVVSGRAMVAMSDGTQVEMRAGDLFHIGPGHDSWVLGDDPYVSLHFLGAEDYAMHW
jgi:mannose-6-phosphate isomerase-like protein (cupin superfamily)